jgi:hypothetical protein
MTIMFQGTQIQKCKCRVIICAADFARKTLQERQNGICGKKFSNQQFY